MSTEYRTLRDGAVLYALPVQADEPDTQEETVRLAVESARRWSQRRDLTPELRLRRMWTVLVTALYE